MRKTIFSIALLSSVSLASATPPYVGSWVAGDMVCEEAIVISETAINGAENECRFLTVMPGQANYLVEAICTGEGMPPVEQSFAFNFENGNLLLADEDGQVATYRRCD